MPETPLTILDALRLGESFLEKKGVENARRTMQLLMAHVLQTDHLQLYLNFDKPIEHKDQEQLRSFIKRRSQQEPLQYILGESEFFRRMFHCDQRGLIPRPETEELVELLLPKMAEEHRDVLDVGTGSGVIGLTIALERKRQVQEQGSLTLSDCSREALALAAQNAKRHKVQAECIESHLWDQIPMRTYHVIVANLPYIALRDRAKLSPEVLKEPHEALFSGEDGLDLIREFVRSVDQYLAPGGVLAMEVGYDQGRVVCGLLEEAGLRGVELKKDLSGIERFPFAQNLSK